jgi:hypothetical protein
MLIALSLYYMSTGKRSIKETWNFPKQTTINTNRSFVYNTATNRIGLKPAPMNPADVTLEYRYQKFSNPLARKPVNREPANT